ncbi:MAG: alkaline shock response membrane anchor protein AmaP [Clostridiales bacterium]|nr:alkaline shock response membrane anchor protein AmaP [Clostridiales bacterium]
MNSFIRVLTFIYSVFIALLSVILLYALVDDGIFSDLLSPLSSIANGPVSKYVYAAVLILFLVTAVIVITNTITYGRLNRTRLRKTEIGNVDIGSDAIESIALNSAKSAQVGIKSARCHVSPGKDGAIRLDLSCVLYSNVEIPSSMAKVQEKIKKDIERFTGIVVENVSVRVARVEEAVAKVEGR